MAANIILLPWADIRELYVALRRLPRDDRRHRYYQIVRDEIEIDDIFNEIDDSRHIAIKFLWVGLGWRVAANGVYTPIEPCYCPAA